MKIKYFLFLLAVLLFEGCNHQNTSNSENNLDVDIQEQTQTESDTEQLKEGLPIFYNMMLTVELSTLFSDSRAIFDYQVMNSETNYINYQISYEKALNLGVYAVDLSYANVYEQFGYCSKYLQSMMKLSNDLGIPYTFIAGINKSTKGLNDSDSLYYYSNKLYNQTREYLRANEQEYASVLIILGGWVEAMHISLKMAEQTASSQIIEKIANQKSSIESLLDLLSKEQKNQTVALYIPKIKNIQVKLDFFAANYGNKSGITAFNELLQSIEGLRNEITLQDK